MTRDLSLKLRTGRPGPFVDPDVYGHFAEHLGRCVYEGIWVGEDSPIPNTRGIRDDVVQYLRALHLPVLRWPGGCFADDYHWMDGIGPREKRPKRRNNHWGGVVETNHFGTHEFLDFCQMIGARPYICGNVGSGSVQEMSQWVEYLNSDDDTEIANLRRANGRDKPWNVPYFGVGNENWGCGGNMRPEFYADEFRRFRTFLHGYGDHQMKKFACGANAADLRWTEVLMERAGPFMDGLSLHYYTGPGGWPPAGFATDFDAKDHDHIIKAAYAMKRLLREHIEIMDRFDPERRVGLIVDEWGTWFAVEPGTNPSFLYQQNTMRDALVAALTLHLFHEQAARVKMANIAQLTNVLQAVVLTEGPRSLRTPTYWVFEMFRRHQGGDLAEIAGEIPQREFEGEAMPMVSVSATTYGDTTTISLANLDLETTFATRLEGGELLEAHLLSSEAVQDHNTFDDPDHVCPRGLEVRSAGNELRFEMPPHSVAVLQIR